MLNKVMVRYTYTATASNIESDIELMRSTEAESFSSLRGEFTLLDFTSAASTVDHCSCTVLHARYSTYAPYEGLAAVPVLHARILYDHQSSNFYLLEYLTM
jgi:hypothetical protein